MKIIFPGSTLAALFSICLIFTVGCEDKPAPSSPPSATPETGVGQSDEEETRRDIRLKPSGRGGVLVLEEEGAEEESPPAGDEGLSGESSRPRADHPPFQDHHVKLYAAAVGPALGRAVNIAVASGAQVITYPIKGFENMGPNEKTLVFDYRTYRPFLKKVEALGRLEYGEIIRSDFVTVRFTVLTEVPTGPDGQ